VTARELPLLPMRIAVVAALLPQTPSGFIRMPKSVRGFARRLFRARFRKAAR
jgi:hypothetical protein